MDVSSMLPLAAELAQQSAVSSRIIDQLAETATRSHASTPEQGEKTRSFLSQLYTSPSRGNAILNGVLNQGGFLTVGVCVGCERRAARVA